MGYDFVVSGRIWSNGNFIDGEIAVKEGIIQEVKPHINFMHKIDFGNKVILPAGIDMHVHFREPGMTHKETIESGSMSAIYGGLSTYVDMPNTIPPTSSIDAIKDKLSIMEKHSYADYGVYAFVGEKGVVKKLSAYVDAFKIYLAPSTGNIVLNNLEDLKEISIELSDSKKFCVVHAEDSASFGSFKERTLEGYSTYRSCYSEKVAIENILSLKSDSFHIAHVSCPDNVDLLKGKSFEVTPHHLLLSYNMPLGTFGKVNPPLRSEHERILLMEKFVNNEIPILASDHAPHTLDEKEVLFDKAPSGIPGVETMYPLFVNLAKKSKVPLEVLIKALCINPAKKFGINAGSIEKSKDASFAVFDMHQDKSIKGRHLHGKSEWSPFEGFEAIFPTDVFIRGIHVVKNGFVNANHAGKRISEYI
jgi:dihydroorotase